MPKPSPTTSAGTVLLLGGTAEARALAGVVAASGRPVVSSLAGAVRDPRMPEGDVRVGGFGGVDGLVAYLREHRIDAVVDATHPFARVISTHAVTACRATGTPLLRLERPGWSRHPRAGAWHWVDDPCAAARTAATLGARILLTSGRQHLADFVEPLADRAVVARVVDPPDVELPRGWTIVRSRGPYTHDGETDLLRRHGIQVLVTKDSGGEHTAAKLDAATELGVHMVVIRRPARLNSDIPAAASVAEAIDWLERVPGSP